MRRRTAALAVVVATTTFASACSEGPSGPGFAGPNLRGEGSWTELPAGPLDARRSAHLFWVGGELYVIGGTDAPPCPPNADCMEPEEASKRDGAAYDPDTETWRGLATAPLPVGEASKEVVGDRIYFLLWGYGSSHPTEREAFVAYDTSDDEWSELTMPPGGNERLTLALAPANGRLIAFHSSQEYGYSPDQLYEPGSDTWTELPKDPLAPSFDRSVVWTSHGLVVTGIEHVPNPGVEPAIYRAAIHRDGRWERGADSDIVGWDPTWRLLEGKIVNMSLGTVDGGETNPYERPFVTGGILDPRSMSWSDLPNAPHDGDPSALYHASLLSGVYAFSDRWGLGYQGFAYDARSQRWYALERPEDGPEHEMGAAWMGDRLAIFGGISWSGDDFDAESKAYGTGWVWAP